MRGNRLDSIVVLGSSKPFIMTVVTNNNEVDDIANRGFSLDYAQQACATDSNNLALVLAMG